MKKKTNLPQKILAGVVIGGSILGTAAFLLSAPYEANYEVQPIAEVKAVEMEPEVVTPAAEEPKKVEVAIAHEDQGDFVEIADQALADGDLKASFTALRKSLHGMPPSLDVLLRIGRIGREIRELEIAEEALKQATELDPRVADPYVELARIHLSRDEHEEAHELATKAIEIEREHAPAWNLVGRAAMSLSNWQRAEAALARAVELDPLNAMYRNNLGLLFIHMKRADEAIDELETAVELFEDDAPHFAFNNLGLAHEMAGNFEEARTAFEEALTISPFYARAKVNLDRVEKTIAEIEEARAFETAKSLEPKIDFEGPESL